MTTDKTAADAKTIANFTTALEAIAESIRVDEFPPALVKPLGSATTAFAEARGEDPAITTALVDEVAVAMKDGDATGTREALDALAEHFGQEIRTAPPTGSADGGAIVSLRGETVQLTAQEVAGCKAAGARLRSFAANKLVRARARAASTMVSGVGRTVAVKGQLVRLTASEVVACKETGATPEAYAANKLIRARATGATVNLAGQIQERKGSRT